eukprot:GHVU01124297.1.p1 GENE.GHVU01124297.1~~GHVU01124297.1.p1  ORF type:complete len:180 (-),score=10.36 GHVU01124297.1:242-781(-)
MLMSRLCVCEQRSCLEGMNVQRSEARFSRRRRALHGNERSLASVRWRNCCVEQTMHAHASRLDIGVQEATLQLGVLTEWDISQQLNRLSCLSLRLPVCLSLSLYVVMSICHSLSLSLYLYLYLSICPSVYLPVGAQQANAVQVLFTDALCHFNELLSHPSFPASASRAALKNESSARAA